MGKSSIFMTVGKIKPATEEKYYFANVPGGVILGRKGQICKGINENQIYRYFCNVDVNDCCGIEFKKVVGKIRVTVQIKGKDGVYFTPQMYFPEERYHNYNNNIGVDVVLNELFQLQSAKRAKIASRKAGMALVGFTVLGMPPLAFYGGEGVKPPEPEETTYEYDTTYTNENNYLDEGTHYVDGVGEVSFDDDHEKGGRSL